MDRKLIKNQAKELINVDYWMFVGVYAVYTAIISALSGSYGVALLILGGPITVGFISYILKLKRNNNAKFVDLFSGFQSFGKYLVTFLLVSLFTFLWTLLFIIPGIIKGLSYSQALYLIYDNPNMSPKEAIKKSQEMMNGHKKELFILELSFIGWHLLGIITLGIVEIFYVGPYYNSALAIYYENLKPAESNDNSNTETVEGTIE